MIKDIITRPQYHGIKANKRGSNTEAEVIGFDCETCHGKIISMQFAGSYGTDLIFCDSNTAEFLFLDYLKKHSKGHRPILLYSHNIGFDMPAVFPTLDWSKKTITIKRDDITIRVFADKTWFLSISRGLRVLWTDSSKFYTGSLSHIASVLGFPSKLKTPVGLGTKLFTKDDFTFCEYAKRDAVIVYELGCIIWGIHREYNVRSSVSIAHLASLIFRHKFMMKGDFYKLPKPDLCKLAVESYFGGKNAIYKSSGYYKNIKSLDIISAYAYAMSKIPNFLRGRWVHTSQIYDTVEGIYRVWGVQKPCKYPVLWKRPDTLEGVAITSYELKAMLKYNEIELTAIDGWVWDSKPAHNPLKDYVTYFYNKKYTASDDRHRLFYKTMLNALYGKFIQTVEIDKDEPDYKISGTKLTKIQKQFLGGGLYNPVIGSLITGFIRVYIHELEHRYNAIHTATDSIFTQAIDIQEKSGLGGYKIDCEGNLLLLRNKLYIFYNQEGKIIKNGLHGFFGTPEVLASLWHSKKTSYQVERILKVREAIRQKKQPLEMVLQDRNLNIGLNKIMNIDKLNYLPDLIKFFNSNNNSYDDFCNYTHINPITFTTWLDGIHIPNYNNQLLIKDYLIANNYLIDN